MRNGGVIANLSKGDIFEQDGFKIIAQQDSKIYFSQSGDNFSSAVLSGAIQQENNKSIESGEIFVRDIKKNKTETHSFDTAHFLEKTDGKLAQNIENNLKKTAAKQEKQKSMGLFEDSNTTIRSEEADQILASFEAQDITSVRVNNETLDLRSAVEAGFIPLHLLVKWGAGASDLDIHLTGPKNDGSGERFHLFFLNTGTLDDPINALITDDCISSSCSEVIRIDELNKGGNYTASVYNFGDERKTSNNLSTQSNVEFQVVRGGTLVRTEGDLDLGIGIEGGDVLFTGSPTAGQVGNTWKAVEINPENSDINFINEIFHMRRPQIAPLKNACRLIQALILSQQTLRSSSMKILFF